MRRIDPRRSRMLLLAAGTGVLALIAVVMYLRGVDPVEVLGTLLFVPVFLGVVFGKVRGGIAAGVVAAAVYAALRLPAITTAGLGPFVGLLLTRSLGYVAFGGLGGWGMRQVEASLDKLERYDQVDDATGLGNARLLLQELELETSRADRYATMFSVVVVDVPAQRLASLSRKARWAAFERLGGHVRDSIRLVDRAVHAFDGTRHRFAVVLPETEREGADILVGRLAKRVAGELPGQGGGKIASRVATYPADAEALAQLRSEFAAIERVEHPAAASR